ncbi:hypothetical protein [Streptomyces abikoensis]|uniref:hypothetical protein n=1 Tax=Streptomyces abikoensis TaxID=97398 RepID=UPI001674352C|nr:hypothetical protein [Streptomyces abikoensis]GGP47271.1 hypothetical protein GCM10010214_20550 [Streptomyces abikoensis]
MRRDQALLAVTASVVAFGLVGCGSDDSAKVPTAAGGATSKVSGTTSGQGGGGDMAAYVKAQREYAKCLRENGVDAPDPDAKGNLDFGDGDHVRALKRDPKFRTASAKCAPSLSAVPESVEKNNRPKLSPEQIKTMRKYAECMQKNGAPDFPDPGADGFGEGRWDQSSAAAQRALRVCGPIAGAPTSPGPGKG